jgi:hypothetical protein
VKLAGRTADAHSVRERERAVSRAILSDRAYELEHGIGSIIKKIYMVKLITLYNILLHMHDASLFSRLYDGYMHTAYMTEDRSS